MDKKNQYGIQIEKNAFENKGDGLVKFPNGLVITDDSEQRNGTKYDIKSMDVSEYKGNLTANHSMDIQKIIGKVKNVEKQMHKVTVGAIQFAVKENALALYAYNMLIGGYLTDFSIETFGPYPDEEGKYFNSKLVGLSAVVIGNNRGARINEIEKIAINSMEQAKKEGLNTEGLEKEICYNNLNDIKNSKSNDMKYVTVKNSRDFSIVVKYKNAAGVEVEKNLAAGETVDVSEDQKATVENFINSASAPQVDIAGAMQTAMAPLTEKIKELEQKIFDNSAKEPEFKKDKKIITASYEGMNYKQLHGKQINAAWEMLKGGNMEAGQKLSDINKFNLEKLQEAGIVENTITIADMGNFVISPELLKDIEGHRSDFTSLISRLDYRETLSLQMAWLTRSGDINMQEVEHCDDGAEGNLKPISEYTAGIQTSNLHELAAVTPVCNAATRFLAADLLGDVAAGYRNDYDRKRAQLYIARLQQAVNTTGNTVTYATTTDTAALKSFVSTWSSMTEEIMNGTFIFNQKTYGELVSRMVGAGISGPLAGVFTTGDQPTLLGRPYIVVPNELLPNLNTATTKTFTVEGVAVSINKAVFYTDLSTFSGRTSGGLQYDLSTEAAYEVDTVVKSAFQRNELVLRGSFFRGGAIRDTDKVVAMGAPGVS